MAAAIAEVSADMDATKKKKAAACHLEIVKAADKQKKKAEDKAIKKEALMTRLKQDIDERIIHMHSLPIKYLLPYDFDVKGSDKIGKQLLKESLTAAIDEE